MHTSTGWFVRHAEGMLDRQRRFAAVAMGTVVAGTDPAVASVTAAIPMNAPPISGHFLFVGLAVGVVVGLGAYNLALYFFVRNNGYRQFAAYTLAAGAYVLSVKNVYLSALWPSFPIADSILSWCLIMLTIQGFIRFTQEFLHTRETMPIGHKILLGVHNLIYAGPIIGAPVIGFGWRGAGFTFNSIMALVTFGIVITMACRCHRTGFRPAKAYLAGNLFFCVGGAVYGMGFLGVVPPYPLFADLVIIGIVFQSMFFSLGVADRMARLRADLARQSMEKERFERQLVEAHNRQLEEKIGERTAELEAEKEETERLLFNILPIDVARELRARGVAAPRRHGEASIIFTDFVGFTTTVGTMPARRLVQELNHIFSAFDRIVESHGIEKIKTIGDAYLAACGLPHKRSDHALVCVTAALAMQAFIHKQNEENAIKWRMRVGIHSGAVVAGVVGRRKFTYDIWGDTVNIAARMETAAEAGRINVSAYTYDLIREDVACEYRGKIHVKGKGKIDMYHVTGLRQAAPSNRSRPAPVRHARANA
jgi:adenylate cyclase